jgi:hypothetical protein
MELGSYDSFRMSTARLKNARMVLQIRPRPRPSTRFLIHLLIILPFKATQSQLLKALLNNP